jgi:cellobiose phosphorylase
MTYAPLFDENTFYKTFFEDGEVIFFSKQREIEGRVSVSVNPKYDCEIREITIKNISSRQKNGSFLFYTEPVLTERVTEASHPAFSNLFIQGEWNPDDKILYLTRRVREKDETTLWMAIGISDEISYEFELTRFRVLERLKGVKNIATAFTKTFTGKTAAPVDPCIAVKINLPLKAKEIRTFTIYTAVGETKNDAFDAINKTRKISYNQLREASKSMTLSLYIKNGLKKEDVKLYELLLSSVFIKSPARQNSAPQTVCHLPVSVSPCVSPKILCHGA